MLVPPTTRFWHILAATFLIAALGCRESDAQPRPSVTAPASPTPTEKPTDAKASAAWPNWRGPTGQGLAADAILPEKWPTGDVEPLWKSPVAEGWSSPVVDGGRVFVTDRDGMSERVLAFDADTGRPLWQRATPVDFDPHAVGRRHGNGPKSTPVASSGRVYALGIAGLLQCLDARDGSVVWSVNYPAAFGVREPLPGGRAYVNREENVIVPIGNGQGAPVPLFGYTGSLAHDGDLLISFVGGGRAGTLVAFNKQTGDVVWKSLDENVSYSSPVVTTLGGVRQVVTMTGPRVVGLDLADGRLLWSYPFQIQYDESIATPAVGDDTVVVTGDGHPLTALRIAKNGDKWSVSVAWEDDGLSSYLSSPLVNAGRVYGMSNSGEIFCLNIADGKDVWVGGSHGYYCTPVLAGRQLLCLNERCELEVLATDAAEFRSVASCRLGRGGSWTSPAVVGSRLYLRTGEDLRCVDFSAPR